MSAFLYRVGVEIVAHGDRHKMAAVTGPTRPGQLVQTILVVAGHSHPQLGFGDPYWPRWGHIEQSGPHAGARLDAQIIGDRLPRMIGDER